MDVSRREVALNCLERPLSPSGRVCAVQLDCGGYRVILRRTSQTVVMNKSNWQQKDIYGDRKNKKDSYGRKSFFS